MLPVYLLAPTADRSVPAALSARLASTVGAAAEEVRPLRESVALTGGGLAAGLMGGRERGGRTGGNCGHSRRSIQVGIRQLI